jgi:glycosyltransferase involved in cell wall biosynthesis
VYKKPLTLSIIIPVYNEQSHLKTCLESIAWQTEMPNEVIVVDNNSTDNTVKIAQSFPFVTLIHEKKQGVLHARNKGFDTATGDILGRVDADSILAENWCANVRKIFLNGMIGAATGPVVYYDMPFRRAGFKIDKTIRQAIDKFNDDFPYLFGTNMALKRSVWQKYRNEFCKRKDVHEDLDIGIHLTKHNEHIAYNSKMVVGMSARRFDNNPKDFYRYISFYKSSFAHHGIETNTTKFAMATYIFAYFLLRPVRLMYDDEKKGFDIRQLFATRQARKHPMD